MLFYQKVILPTLEKQDENYMMELSNIYFSKIFSEFLLPSVNSLFKFWKKLNINIQTKKHFLELKV